MEKGRSYGLFSERVAEVVDYEEVAGFLKDLKEYHCFLEDEGAGIRRVSVAKKAKGQRGVCLSHGGGAKRLRHMENFQYRERGEGINGKSGIAQGLL